MRIDRRIWTVLAFPIAAFISSRLHPVSVAEWAENNDTVAKIPAVDLYPHRTETGCRTKDAGSRHLLRKSPAALTTHQLLFSYPLYRQADLAAFAGYREEPPQPE